MPKTIKVNKTEIILEILTEDQISQGLEMDRFCIYVNLANKTEVKKTFFFSFRS